MSAMVVIAECELDIFVRVKIFYKMFIKLNNTQYSTIFKLWKQKLTKYGFYLCHKNALEIKVSR